MRKETLKYLPAVSLAAIALMVTGCQQAPPASTAPSSTTVITPAPAPAGSPAPATTESTTNTKSTEVKPADPNNPDAGGKMTTTDSTTTKTKQ